MSPVTAMIVMKLNTREGDSDSGSLGDELSHFTLCRMLTPNFWRSVTESQVNLGSDVCLAVVLFRFQRLV